MLKRHRNMVRPYRPMKTSQLSLCSVKLWTPRLDGLLDLSHINPSHVVSYTLSPCLIVPRLSLHALSYINCVWSSPWLEQARLSRLLVLEIGQ